MNAVYIEKSLEFDSFSSSSELHIFIIDNIMFKMNINNYVGLKEI